MKKLIYILLLAGVPLAATAQSPTFSIGNEENFAFSVKAIDEFIERFNGDSTLLADYGRQKKTIYKLDRVSLLKGLFDASAQPQWDLDDVKQFINQVNNSEKPVYLDFLQEGWFAEADCRMSYKGKTKLATLLLQVEVEADSSCKWVIAGVKAPYLPTSAADSFQILHREKPSLNPVSHATDFMGLHKALNDRKNVRNYFSLTPDDRSMRAFIRALESGDQTYEQVNSVVYHFLQVEGWAFKVQQFNRRTKNAGWLISHLSPMDDSAKAVYKANLIKTP